MLVKNDLVSDGSLKIFQDTDLNSFTIDSVLLFNYVKVNKKDQYIIDLCAGNGPVTMLLANKYNTKQLYGVEIQKEVYDLGKKSIIENEIKNIDFINKDLIGINKIVGQNKFDIVTCNPPYFKVTKTSRLNSSDSISVSRHELKVTLSCVLKEAKTLLKNNGRLVMVHRPERLCEIILSLNEFNFHIHRIRFIYPKLGKKSNTIVFEARKGKEGKMLIDPPLYIYDNDDFSKEYLDMCRN